MPDVNNLPPDVTQRMQDQMLRNQLDQSQLDAGYIQVPVIDELQRAADQINARRGRPVGRPPSSGPPPNYRAQQEVGITDAERAIQLERLRQLARAEESRLAELANVNPPTVREYPLAELHAPAQVLIDNGMVVRDPTGWEIFALPDGAGYGVSHEDARDHITRFQPHVDAVVSIFTEAWDNYCRWVTDDRERFARAT